MRQLRFCIQISFVGCFVILNVCYSHIPSVELRGVTLASNVGLLAPRPGTRGILYGFSDRKVTHWKLRLVVDIKRGNFGKYKHPSLVSGENKSRSLNNQYLQT